MKNLLIKEIKLVVSPAVYLFGLLSALLLIPSYPYIVGVSYFIFAIQITFGTARANNDHLFTAMLPIPRSDVVLSKHINVIYTQAVQLLFAVPFAVISSLVLNKSGNPVGMDANLTFFGEALIAFSVFNIVFLPEYFKSGYKMGVPLLLAIAAYILFIAVFEFTVAFVGVLHQALDGIGRQNIYQAIVFVVGIIIYILTMYLSYELSKKRFEKVNL